MTAANEAAGPALGEDAHDLRGLLHIAPFRRLWVALSLSSLGDWLGLLATSSLATELFDSYRAKTYALGGVLFVRLLPALVLGPLAGAFADRFDRRKTMVSCDLVRFGLFVSIPVVHTLPWLLVASFLIEAASLFWIPAKEASVPNLVPKERLEAANQLSLLTTYGSAPFASAVFALLALVNSALAAAFPFFRTNPVDLALYFNGATFLFSALTIATLRGIAGPRRAARTDGRERILTEIAEGWRFVRGDRLLRGIVVGMTGAFAAGGTVIALGRVFVDLLRAGNAGYGVLFGTLFVGLAGGMFLGPRLFTGLSRPRLLGIAIVGAGTSLAATALCPNLVLAVVTTFGVGAFAGIAWVVGFTLVGKRVPDEIRGRTFSFLYTLMRADLLLVLAAAPLIAGAIGNHRVHLLHVSIRLDGVTGVLLVSGLTAVAVGVVAYRQMDDRPGVPLRTDLIAAFRGGVVSPPRLPGCLVAFEGGEGVGKSTQVRLLGEWLTGQGYDVVLTREPGATAAGRRVREVLLDPQSAGLSLRAEALLYAADRADHVDNLIRPALERGAVVVTDRYVDSSLAYQGAGRRLAMAEVERLSAWATGGLQPDLTVVLDIRPVVGLARAGSDRDRLEAEPTEFHERVRRGFLRLAARSPQRYLVCDASRPPEEIAAEVRDRLARLLPPPVPQQAARSPQLAQQ
jgi:dTMP kinase